MIYSLNNNYDGMDFIIKEVGVGGSYHLNFCCICKLSYTERHNSPAFRFHSVGTNFFFQTFKIVETYCRACYNLEFVYLF